MSDYCCPRCGIRTANMYASGHVCQPVDLTNTLVKLPAPIANRLYTFDLDKIEALYAKLPIEIRREYCELVLWLNLPPERRHHNERLKSKRKHYQSPKGAVCSCLMCGNPRKYGNELTIQERRHNA